MREPEERQRHFVITDKKNEDYDKPAVTRRAFPRVEDDSFGEEKKAARKPRAHLSLREREQEEEKEESLGFRGRLKRSAPQKEEPFDDDFDDEFDDDDERRPKAPKVVRFFAWGAFIIILFTVGYTATNFFFSWSDRRGGERIGNVYGGGNEVAENAEDESTNQVRYSIYIPDGTSFQSRIIELNPGTTREEDMQRVLTMYVDSMKETQALEPAVDITNIFQSGEWLYVDLTGAFQSSIKKLKREEARRLLNGMANTIRDNFPPITKIKFYVDSKEIADKSPVDLTVAWEAE